MDASRLGCALLVFLSCLSVQGAANYTNPVIRSNAPDPGVLFFKGVYYAATTSNNDINHYPIHTSVDLVTWHRVAYIFPQDSKTQPKWAVSDYWAPEIHIINNKFIAFFAARDTTGVLCIGAAYSLSDSPLGPYQDIGHPLVKNGTMGSIDATYFLHRDSSGNSQPLLIWKNDGNAVGLTTYIWVQPLNPDGMSLKSGTSPLALIRNDLPWEAAVVEGPWLIERRGIYYLFYSANGYDAVNPDGTCKYAVGVAKSKSPFGPFVKYPDPIMHSTVADSFTGPGHCSVVQYPQGQGDKYFMVYHAWSKGRVGGGYPRHMLVDSIGWDRQGWPNVYKSYPSDTPQPVP